MTTPEQGPRTVAVWQHATRTEVTAISTEICRQLHARGMRVLAPAEDLDLLRQQAPDLPVEALDDSPVEIALIFGGDGSILRAAEWARPRGVPLLGVNLGHVGFLAELDKGEHYAVVDAVFRRTYDIERRMTLETELTDESGAVVWSSWAVNEVAMEKSSRERMLEVEVDVDSVPLSRWGCDGVLVATPTGSTAYAFSAGGPVIWPDVEAMLMVPISAHALFNKPVVLSPGSVIEVSLVESAETEGVVWCDGRRTTPLRGGSTMRVRAGGQPLLLARVTDESFTSRLQRKFGLRVEGWRGAAEKRC